MFATALRSTARRSALLSATRRQATAASTSSLRPQVASAALRPAAFAAVVRRGYASSGALSKENIQSRIVEVLKSFEKVDPAKVQASSAFTDDLGLDSLDAVEVVMAIEEEFSIEIPDEEADNITTVQQAIDYISKSPEAH